MLVFFSGSAYSSSPPGNISVSLNMNNYNTQITAQVWANTEDHMTLIPVFGTIVPQAAGTNLVFTLGLGENTIADNDVFNITILEIDA